MMGKLQDCASQLARHYEAGKVVVPDEILGRLNLGGVDHAFGQFRHPLVMLTLLPGTGGRFDVIAPRTPRGIRKLRIFHAELRQQISHLRIRTKSAKS